MKEEEINVEFLNLRCLNGLPCSSLHTCELWNSVMRIRLRWFRGPLTDSAATRTIARLWSCEAQPLERCIYCARVRFPREAAMSDFSEWQSIQHLLGRSACNVLSIWWIAFFNDERLFHIEITFSNCVINTKRKGLLALIHIPQQDNTHPHKIDNIHILFSAKRGTRLACCTV